MAELIIGGEAFHVVIEGDEKAPILLLSNALGTTLHMWDPQMPSLLEHYRVLRYDARGHGDSVVSEGPYSIAGLGQDALAILDTLGLEKVDFLGLSLGGVVGQWLLTHAPKRIGKAVLADTASQVGSPDLWNSRIQTVLQDGMEAVAPGIIENWFTKDFRDSHPEEVAAIEEMVLKTPPQGYAATSAALRDFDLREAIRSVRAPVLVLVGRHDTTTPPGLGALMTSAIPKAKLVTLEASHLSNIEDAAQFTEKALEFLLAAPEPEPVTAKPPRKPRVKKVQASAAPEPEVVEAPAPVVTPAKAAPKKEAMKKEAPEKKAPEKKAPEKEAPKKAAPEKEPAKKKPVAKAAPKKAPAKKAPVKKAAPKKAATKKAATKKLAVKKTPAKKTVAKKTVAKKSVIKKAPVKKTVAKKAVKKALSSRKTGPVKAAPKPVKKIAAKKTAAKKTKRR